MTKAGLFETRSRLSQIVNKVMHGEEHLILKKNVPVAKIVPIIENMKLHSKDLVEKIQNIRSKIKKGASIDEINQWKQEGRS